MFTRTEEMTVFTGTPTTNEMRKILRNSGFVHVTGLRNYSSYPFNQKASFIGEGVRPTELGKWDSNNGVTAVVTLGGEVWIKAGNIGPESQVVSEFCPNGKGVFVPLSNGEQVSHIDLLLRVVNSNHDIRIPA